MTAKEIEKAKDELYFKYYQGRVRLPENASQPWTHEDEVLMEEYYCREMINSILIYEPVSNTNEGTYSYERYLKPYYIGKPYYNKKPLLTKERVHELIEEQKESFKKATVSHGVYTDGEGCTYNSCDWGD